MPGHDAFLAAIRDEPDNDTPRLVYSDWLEEQGDAARAEFIRVQCRLERLHPGDPSRTALEEREDELLARHEADWLAPLPESLFEWTFKRGFVEEVVGRPSPTLAGLEELFARHVCSHAEFRFNVDRVAELARSPLLEQLRSLFINGTIGPQQQAWARSLLEEPRLAGLRSLRWLGEGDDLLDCLGRRPGAANLSALLLGLTDAGLARLVQDPTLAAITALGACWFVRLTDAGLDTLLAHAERWTGLDLSWNDLDPGRVAELAACSRLTSLDLSCSPPAQVAFRLPAGLQRLEFWQFVPPSLLCRLECLPHLRHLGCRLWGRDERMPEVEWDALADVLARLPGPVLDLELGQLRGSSILPRLARLPGLDRVRSITAEDETLTDADVKALAECTGLTNLRCLRLVGTHLEPEQVRLLAGSPILAGLRELDLWGCDCGDQGVGALVHSPHLRRLTSLQLGMSNLTTASAELLASWPGLPRLRDLRLDSNGINGQGVRTLLRAEGLSPLLCLDLDNNPVGQATLKTAEVKQARERMGVRLLL
jgi:uncharacterized protein (TIGR02996 family)